jgi:hypothetical protein
LSIILYITRMRTQQCHRFSPTMQPCRFHRSDVFLIFDWVVLCGTSVSVDELQLLYKKWTLR